MDNNYINLMDKQPVSHLIQNSQNRAMGIVDQHVIKKINDQNQMQLSDLKTNEDNCAFTLTENNDWLIFEFMRKERLSAIKGKLYHDDDNQEIFIECQYLDQKQQWITCFQSSFRDIMEQKIFPTLKAYGLRFRKMKKTYIPLKFINLNIFVKAGCPYVMQENPFENAYLIHNKYEIVNLMNSQTFYKKIDNLLVAYKRPVVTKLNDVSAYDNVEITDNQNQDIHQYCISPPIWLTYEFDRKYKLSKIQIQLFMKDRRKYDYQIDIKDKKKNWIQVDSGRSGYEPIEVEFINFYPCYGVRIQGVDPTRPQYGIVVVSAKIFAQRGNPRIIQN